VRAGALERPPSMIVSRLVVYEPALIVIAGKAKSVVMPG
jgi:hypothetical protein